jgi:hypothetical protein
MKQYNKHALFAKQIVQEGSTHRHDHVSARIKYIGVMVR